LNEKRERAEPLPHAPPPAPVSRGKLRSIGIIAAVIALLIAAGGIVDREVNAHEVAQWTAQQAIPSVSVVIPQHGVTGTQLVLPGNIAAWYQAPIYARVSGYLKKWYFDYGAHVKQGQVLAAVDTPDLDAQFAAAKANLNAAGAQINVNKAEMQFAKTTYIRWRDSPPGSVSVQETLEKKADYDSATARYDAAIADMSSDQGAVDRLQALERFKLITAPFDGIVTARNTDIGNLINAGSGAGSAPQLFRIADVHEMRVFVQVPQAMSGSITNGMHAELGLPQYPGRTFQAVVATTARAIDTDSRTLLVELHADNSQGLLQPGTYAEVHFNLPPNPDMLTIPTTALVFREEGLQVAVVGADGRAKLKSVTLGRNLGNDIEVLTGLSTSDRVINSPPDSLSDGELVSVAHPLPAHASDLARAHDAVERGTNHDDPPAGTGRGPGSATGQPGSARPGVAR
jgi:RND family efflux transporter MFP subunit